MSLQQRNSCRGTAMKSRVSVIRISLGLLYILCGFFWFSCRRSEQFPIGTANLTPAAPEVVIRDWQIIGPFKITDFPNGTPPEQIVRKGIEIDYLKIAGSPESETTESRVQQISETGFPWSNDSGRLHNIKSHFDNGIVRFDRIFPAQINSVAYAANVIESDSDKEVILAFGADTQLKFWLNGTLFDSTEVASQLQTASRNIGRDGWFVRVSLKKGGNFLLTKTAQSHRMWGFNCSILTLDAARKKAGDNELYVDEVIDQPIVPAGSPLKLDRGLLSLHRNLQLPYQVEILDVDGKKLFEKSVNYTDDLSLSMSSATEGIYRCRFISALYVLEKPFFYGDLEAYWAGLEKRFEQYRDPGDRKQMDVSPLIVRRSYLYEQENKQLQDAIWQRKLVFLLNEFKDSLDSFDGKTSEDGYPGTHLRAYRSTIDQQQQYYMIHYPRRRNAVQPPPLVVVVPYPLPTVQPFLKSFHLANVSLVNNYTKLADKYGYAILWPFARGNSEAMPLAMTDIFEAISAAKVSFKFDESRLNLLGWSYGGTYALQLGARFPGRFASISAIMTPSDLVAFEKAADKIHSPFPIAWLKLNNPFDLAQNFSNTPLYIIHGLDDNKVPFEQSVNFVNRCRQLGFDPQLELIPEMDHAYASNDPLPRVFDFFRDKVLVSTPEHISFTTAQLKYGTAYWMRVTGLNQSPGLSSIQADRKTDDHIDVKTENISSYEILLNNLGNQKDNRLQVWTNGQLSFDGVPSGSALQITVEPQTQPSAGSRPKNEQIEGPVAHAFANPFIVVEGTTGRTEEQTVVSRIKKQICEEWEKGSFGRCPVVTDANLTPQDILEKNLVLIGNADVNSVSKKVLPNIPISIEPEAISLGQRKFTGRRLGLIVTYPNPLNKEKYVVIITANNPEGFRLAESNLAVKGWFDFMVWNYEASSNPKVLAAGFWDKWWQSIYTLADMN